MRHISAAIIILAFTTPLPALADEQNDVLKAILACRTISDDTARLACMDAASAAAIKSAPVASAPHSPQPPQAQVSLEAERAALAKERAELEQQRAALEAKDKTAAENERNGLLARLGLGDASQQDEKIATTITINRAVKNRQSVYTLYTSDGDIIQQEVNSRRMRLPDNLPATATIELRTLGSKWLTFTEKPSRSYKVKIIQP